MATPQLTRLEVLKEKLSKSSKLTIMISVSRDCVLACNYCYAIDPENLPKKRIIADHLVEKLIRDAFHTRHKHITFEWTGGEAMLAGRGFYERVLDWQEKYKVEGKVVHNCMQTSGGIYDEDFFDFLIDHGFNLSLTIDGPKDLHEMQRPTKGLGSSFDRVLKSYHYIKKKQSYCGVLCTLTKNTLGRQQDILNFYKELGVEIFHTNPYVYDPQKPKQDQALAVTHGEYAEYFINQFDTYLSLNETQMTPNHITYLMKEISGVSQRKKCTNSGICLTNFINIDDVGNAAICPKFLGYENMRLGNIEYQTLDEILSLNNPMMNKFVEQRLKTVNGCESEGCKYLSVCNSGCPYDSFLNSPEDAIDQRDYLCPGKEKIYKHIEKRLNEFGVETINSR